MRKLQNVLVTGGAGFIGCNFIHFLLSEKSGFTGRVINVDSLTYAGNLESLSDVEKLYGGKKYFFEKVDICARDEMERVFSEYDVDTVVHFAAESHVDRSILGPESFIKTNVMGTFTLLECAKNYWSKNALMREDVLFHHVSTDEVYGSLGKTGKFSETTPYSPRSPYSASKAASDHLVMSYCNTYRLPVTLSNCSNNYGPYQFPEKFLPLMITNIKESKPLPVYGNGKNIRDWIYVEDHNNAVWLVMKNGRCGEKYNIGGENEWQNIELLYKVVELCAKELDRDAKQIEKLITFVKDRPGHDERYTIDCTKIKNELGWKREVSFEEGLEKTIKWYLSNEAWVKNVKSGAYREWLSKNYDQRK